MSTELLPYQDAIKRAKDRFQKVAASSVNYDKESIFAMQALMKTSFAMDTANKNPQSVHLAMINVGSTGLTLNPANGYAYLVPRDGAIMLDISYKGLIKIATDSGSIVWARADIVYQDDAFTYHGPAVIPEHIADPFKVARGEIVGAYCIAKTRDGDILTEVMPVAELKKIRSKSPAFVKKNSGPWAEWFEQMAKKAVIKRASKTWPYTDDRLAQAIEVANDAEGGYDLNGDARENPVPRMDLDDKRKADCDDAYEQYGPSVDLIKEQIAEWDETENDNCLYTVKETWGGVPQSAQMALWLAPSKGGIFTTHERSVIKDKLPREHQEAAA